MYYLPSINEFRFYHATFFLRTLLVASEVILSLPMCHKHFVEPLSQIRRESITTYGQDDSWILYFDKRVRCNSRLSATVIADLEVFKNFFQALFEGLLLGILVCRGSPRDWRLRDADL
jgi:hypothetical protein